MLYSTLIFVLELPLAYYAGFVRPHAYGLSTESFGDWLQDALVGHAVGLIIGGLVIWVPYLLMQKSPRRWWLYSALAAIPFSTFMFFISPLWIAPLFNDFGPMQNKTLEARILALAERSGIEGGRVFEVDKSSETRTLNAYVTGIGESKRIVLWDTLLEQMNEAEVLFVMGHEMGHYVLGHMYSSLLLMWAGAFVSCYSIHRLAHLLLARFATRFGFSQLSDVASLPLLLLILSLVSFVARPALLAHSRYKEHEADRFALELTRDNHAAATAFVKLQAGNLAHPRPHAWYIWLRSAHPALADRIEFSNRYRPWERGETLRYPELFSESTPATENR